MGLNWRYWGDAAIPAMYEYNAFGEITDLYLFKSAPSSASAFTGETWNSAYNSGHADAEHTSWTYNDATGLVVKKTDALGKEYIAQYDAYGNMSNFTDPNGNQFGYTRNQAGGTLTSTTNGSTMSYSYDNKNRIAGVQYGDNSYSYTYSGDSTMPSVEIFPNSYRLERTFNSDNSVTGVKLKDAQGNVLYEANYAYGAGGKLQSLSAQNKTISYTYNALGSVSEINLNGESKIVNTYDDLQRISSSSYMLGTSELKKLEYNLTSDNKLSKVIIKKEGDAVMNWQYEYFVDSPGLSKASLNSGSGNVLLDEYSQEEFEYDMAGNPYRYKVGSSNWNVVTSNKNNQTSQISYASDNVLPIRGKAPLGSELNIYIDGEKQSYARPANEEGFAYGISGYSATKKYHEVKVEAVGEDSSTTPPSEIRTMQRGSAYVESTPENFTYDNNGNLTSDGRWTYTWNAENRLVSLETSAGALKLINQYRKYEYCKSVIFYFQNSSNY